MTAAQHGPCFSSPDSQALRSRAPQDYSSPIEEETALDVVQSGKKQGIGHASAGGQVDQICLAG